MKHNATLLFLIAAVFFHTNAKAYSQGITLKVSDASLDKVFTLIQKQTKFVFVYSAKQLAGTKRVSVDVKDEKLEKVLQMILEGQPLRYEVDKEYVIIKMKMPALVESLIGKPGELVGRVTNEQGEPVAGATVAVEGSNIVTSTAADGSFLLKDVEASAKIRITSVGYEPKTVVLSGDTRKLWVKLSVIAQQMKEVVISTGLQNIPKERATGSFVLLNNEIINRRVSPDLLSRLDGITSGMLFNRSSARSNEKLGVSIRGTSTLDTRVNADPLIVLDNVIFDGDINDINPNDVDNITVLRDAAAASIWGARSGNGVIVITSKRGRQNQPLKVEFNSNVTVSGKDDLGQNNSFINAKEYIELEKMLFEQGYYKTYLQLAPFFVMTPVVYTLYDYQRGLISQQEMENRIQQLKANDVRKDFEKWLYQKPINQQYSLSLRGGSQNVKYSFSAGFDKLRTSLRRNESNRKTLKSMTSFTPYNFLEISTNLTYSLSEFENNNSNAFGSVTVGGLNGHLYPYARLVDESGNSIPINKDFNPRYVDSLEGMGFMNWRYDPIKEVEYSDNRIRREALLIGFNAKVKFSQDLTWELLYQTESSNTTNENLLSDRLYYTRSLINKFSQRKSDGTFSYPFPKGSIYQEMRNHLKNYNYRTQLGYNSTIRADHSINILAGAEVREMKGKSSESTTYGYDNETGISLSLIDFITYYPTLPYGVQRIPSYKGGLQETTIRFISFYGNFSYSFKDKYVLTGSARKDGANLFGVKVNDKITPLWSMGISWNIAKEKFLNTNWINTLKLRATYGYNGNVYNGTAFLVAGYTGVSIVNTPVAQIIAPPNPNLKWEKIGNVNIGTDFEILGGRLGGSIDWYSKKGKDLLEPLPLSPSSGFTGITANAAQILTKGLDIQLNGKISFGKINWQPVVLLSFIKDEVTKFDYIFPTENARTSYLLTNSKNGGASPNLGMPLFGIYSYAWAGLDENNGDPLGIINGKLSKNYDSLINQTAAKDLIYKGVSRPTVFGAFRNSLSFKGVSLSFNIIYKFGYFFKRNTTSLNYLDVLAKPHKDYLDRWTQKGDEKNTVIPSMVFPSNNLRSIFFDNSEVLVDRADHIRLQDIQIAYTIPKLNFLSSVIENISLYGYVNNIGILWKATNSDLDPDYHITGIVPTKSFSVGIRLLMK